MATRWEYHVMLVRDNTPHDPFGNAKGGVAHEVLNDLGTEGWELVGVAGSDSTAMYRLFFKRPTRLSAAR
jgi:hypothetical protein